MTPPQLNPEKRQKLLDSALQLFVANGLERTSTAEISRGAGVATGTLFIYFPGKIALISELALQIARDQTDNITAHLDPNASARDQFRTIWDCSIGWFRQKIPAYRFSKMVREPGLLPAEVVQSSDQLFQFYYHAIHAGLQEGVLGNYPPELIGGMLYQDIVAVMDCLLANPDPAGAQAYIETGFEIYWNGITHSK
jgi:AcrR family transcriptional regulator